MADDVRARWRDDDGQRLAATCVEALARGDSKGLPRAELGEIDGRLDLRGLSVPAPVITSRGERDRLFVEETTGQLQLRSIKLESLDLSDATLDGLRFFGVKVRDCCFRRVRAHDLRMWASEFRDSSFEEADLRGSMLGAWHEGHAGLFDHVDFRSADFRGVVSSTPDYVDCDFSGARLVKIDFQSSGFVRCKFAGRLQDVIFWDHGFKKGKPGANPMEDVDFSGADLRGVEFRRLTLDRVTLPRDDDQYVIVRYPCVLDAALTTLSGDGDARGRGLRAVLEHRRKWLGPGQQIGLFSRHDLGTSDEQDFALDVLARAARLCGSESPPAAVG